MRQRSNAGSCTYVEGDIMRGYGTRQSYEIEFAFFTIVVLMHGHLIWVLIFTWIW